MPANVAGEHIDAAPYNRNDGFSPGPGDRARCPASTTRGSRRDRRGADHHLGRYREPTQPIVVIDAETGQRSRSGPSSTRTPPAPTSAALLIHPARNFAAGHRYIVALRDLEDGRRRAIQAPAASATTATAALRSSRRSTGAARTSRASSRPCGAAGIERADLYLAWDFTVASDQNIAGAHAPHARRRLRPARRHEPRRPASSRAARRLHVTSVPNFTPPRTPRDRRAAVTGTFTVPCYLAPRLRARAGAFAARRRRRCPTGNGTWTANFDCIIPRSAVAAARRRRRGRRSTATACSAAPARSLERRRRTLANTHNFVLCATD